MVILLLFLSSLSVFSQKKVWNDNLYANNLATFYEGNYTVINNLFIENTDLTDLSLLVNLKEVKGGIYIKNNKNLNNLNGLDSLKIAHSISIIKNENLKSIKALSSLKNSSLINISENSQLRNLQGLENIRGQIKGGITLYENRKLRDISALSNISECGEISFSYCPIKEVKFPILTKVHSKIYLALNFLEVLEFNNLDSITNGGLIIWGSTLTSINGFAKLTYIEHQLEISQNNYLNSIELNHLQEIGWLNMYSNFMLKSIKGFKNLKKLSSISLLENKNLRELVNLRIDEVSSIKIKRNPKLLNLNFLSDMKTTKCKDVEINENLSLRSLKGLEKIEIIDHNLTICYNDSLSSVSSLKNLQVVGNCCEIIDNSLLNGIDLPIKFLKNVTESDRSQCEVGKRVLQESDTLLVYLMANKKLTNDYFYNLTRQDLRIIRNLPYAIKGYSFKSTFLTSYYDRYFIFDIIEYKKHSNIVLTDIETSNINLIQEREKKLTDKVNFHLENIKIAEHIKIPEEYNFYQSYIDTFLTTSNHQNLNIIPVTFYGNRLFNFDLSEEIQFNDETLNTNKIADFIGITFTNPDNFHITVLNNYQYEENTLLYNEIRFYYQINNDNSYVFFKVEEEKKYWDEN